MTFRVNIFSYLFTMLYIFLRSVLFQSERTLFCCKIQAKYGKKLTKSPYFIDYFS